MIVRTRFAPSPTGYLHIGGLRTALYGYLFAKKHGGAFILRIEDTDQERQVEGAVEVITQTLRDTGLTYDEGPDAGGDYGPYVQSRRKDIYAKIAGELIEKGGAYVCFCAKERLDALREECQSRGETFKYDKHCMNLPKEEVEKRVAAGEKYVVRQNVPLSGQTSFSDLVFGVITVDNDTLDDAVLLKSDGMPTYNFANVVDDYLMRITHVIRGTEYLSSTPKYNLLYQSLGWEIPEYLHLPPVMKTAQKKLSKRDGDASFADFAARGYLPEAILNYIALLGWNPGTNQEKFTLEELVQAFDISGINKAPAIFDPVKLAWLNAQYIREMPLAAFHEKALPYYERALRGCCKDTWLLSETLQPRVEYFAQIPEMAAFLAERQDYDVGLFSHKKSKSDEQSSLEAIEAALPVLEALDPWGKDALHEALARLAEEKGWKNARLLWPLRIAMAGQEVTPGGAMEVAVFLGKDEAIKRLYTGKDKLLRFLGCTS